MILKVYTIYRTTNLVNGNYYFGVHKTGNPWDGYLGSGTYIRRAVAKYGAQSFRKDVLFIYDETNLTSAFAKEDELIQCYRDSDPLCMNLRKGGAGGFDYINTHVQDDHRSENMTRLLKRRRENPELQMKWGAAVSKAVSKSNRDRDYSLAQREAARGRLAKGKAAIPKEEFSRHLSESMVGRSLSEDHKQKLRESRTGKLLSEETKHKISIKSLGRRDTPETTKKRCDTQKLIWNDPANKEKARLRVLKGWESRKRAK